MKLLLTLLTADAILCMFVLSLILLPACTHSPTGTDGLTPSLPVYSFPAHFYRAEYKMICMDSTRYDLCQSDSAGHKWHYCFTVWCDWQGNYNTYIHPSGPSIIIQDKILVNIIHEMQRHNYEILRDFPGQVHNIDSLNFF